jgi:hypothetical protein
LAKLKEFSKQNYVSPLNVRGVLRSTRRSRSGFEWLERGYGQRAPGLIELEVSYVWDDLRTDQRFHSLERRVGF